jgi:hypothetical protein
MVSKVAMFQAKVQLACGTFKFDQFFFPAFAERTGIRKDLLLFRFTESIHVL